MGILSDCLISEASRWTNCVSFALPVHKIIQQLEEAFAFKIKFWDFLEMYLPYNIPSLGLVPYCSEYLYSLYIHVLDIFIKY